MKLWDYSKRFARVAQAWMEKNAGRRTPEQLEEQLPGLYLRWLNAPAPWLGGVSPAAYFDQFDDPEELTAGLGQYCRAGIPVPDPLLDRLAAMGARAVPPLTRVLTDADAPEQWRVKAGGVLVEIGEELPLRECVALVASEATPEAVREQACAILRREDRRAEPMMLAAMDGAGEPARRAFLDLLIGSSQDPRLLDWALYGLRNCPDRRDWYASLLLRLGDERAIEPMQQVLRLADVGYVEFMEISNAIESLGGEVTLRREFAGDADYERMRVRPDDGENA